MASLVHTYSMNGFNIAVDGNSGSIHLLDELSFKILEDMQELSPVDDVIRKLGILYKKEDIIEAYDEIKHLKEEGLLFTPISELENIPPNTNNVDNIKALCLHVSHDCNLRCKYCFASTGDYKSGRKLMSRDMAKKAVDYLVENSGKRKNIEIDFFGGEPMLNLKTVKETVSYARGLEKSTGKSFYFTITTNGTLFTDESIKFINENMDNVVISIDGRKEVHDAIRYDKFNKGTYDRIVPDAKKLVAGRKGKSYFIRGTFTSKNIDFSKDVMHLAKLGFREISVEPVVGNGKDFSLTMRDVPYVLEEYERLAYQYLEALKNGEDIRFYHFNLNLYEGPCIYKRITACGAGFEYFAVSPEGYLYPCHQFVGQEEFIMGDLDNGVINNKLKKRFKESNIITKDKCQNCWAKLFCSGGCHANAWFTNGDIDEPDEIACILQKKRIECAIMCQAEINLNKSQRVTIHSPLLA
jgi:uncharacterized protein